MRCGAYSESKYEGFCNTHTHIYIICCACTQERFGVAACVSPSGNLPTDQSQRKEHMRLPETSVCVDVCENAAE